MHAQVRVVFTSLLMLFPSLKANKIFRSFFVTVLLGVMKISPKSHESCGSYACDNYNSKFKMTNSRNNALKTHSKSGISDTHMYPSGL